MKQKLLVILVFLGLIVFIVGCGERSGNDMLGNGDFGEDDYENIVAPNNELGFHFLREVESDKDGNTFISPTSLFMALSMVYNGAEGETKEEMASALQIAGMDVEVLNQANASLMSSIQNDSDQVQLHVGNSIWLNDEFTFEDDFTKDTNDYFNAEVEAIDVEDSKSPVQINNWMKGSTNGKIEEIIDSPLDPSLIAILINAIYFKGDWTNAFDKQYTEERPFYLADGSTKDVPLMTMKGQLEYLENDDFQAVSLPYGKDESMSMNVFLPRKDSSLEEFEGLLSGEDWKLWKSEFQKEQGTIMLPKFQLEFEASLNETLKTLGMKTAFDKDAANFSKMVQEDVPVWISEVKQKTFIDVNEEGTEAAGVTSVEMETTSMPVDQPFHMEVNRPFFIAITDDETDAILFMGLILSPQEGEQI